jgi:hypothetical protein
MARSRRRPRPSRPPSPRFIGWSELTFTIVDDQADDMPDDGPDERPWSGDLNDVALVKWERR